MNSRGFRQRFVFSTLRCSSWLILGLASFGSVLAQEGYSLHRALYDSQVTEVNSYHTPECEEFFASGYGARDPKLEKKCLLLPRALPATGADAADSTKTVEVEIAGTIQRLTDQVTTFVGTIAVLMIVIYGFRISVSFNDSETIEKSKKGIVWCLTGLVVITFAYVIVKTVVSIAFLGQDTEIWIEMDWESGTVMGAPSSDRKEILAVINLEQDSNGAPTETATESLTFNIALANSSPVACEVTNNDNFCVVDGETNLLTAIQTVSNLGQFIMANSLGNNTVKKSIKMCKNKTLDSNTLTGEVKIECSQEVNNTTAEGALYFRVNKHSFCSQLPVARSTGNWKFKEGTEDKETIDAVFRKLESEYEKIKEKTEGKVNRDNYSDPKALNLINDLKELGSTDDETVGKIQVVLNYYEYYDYDDFKYYINKFSPELEVNDNCKQVDGKYGSCTKAALESWCVDPSPFGALRSIHKNSDITPEALRDTGNIHF